MNRKNYLRVLTCTILGAIFEVCFFMIAPNSSTVSLVVLFHDIAISFISISVFYFIIFLIKAIKEKKKWDILASIYCLFVYIFVIITLIQRQVSIYSANIL